MFSFHCRRVGPSPSRVLVEKRGSAAALSLMLLVVLTLFGLGALAVSNIEIQSASKYKAERQAFYAAEAGVARARRQLHSADSWQEGFAAMTGVTLEYSTSAGVTDDQVADWTTTQPAPVTNAQRIRWSSIALGSEAYSVMAAGVDGNGAALSTARVRFVSTGTAGTPVASKTVEVVAVMRDGDIPTVRGAVSASSNLASLGTLTVDGRNHDEDGVLISPGGSGTFAISTTQTFNQGGSSYVGGTDSGGTDHAPALPADPSVIEENFAGTVPTTPDEVMGGDDKGWPEGSLKSIAQSGLNGGQYVTDPSNLTFPLSGVTYVELPTSGPGQTWQSIDFGSPPNHSSGVLVVHNSATNAMIKDLMTGTFKGLLIADDVDKVHSNYNGAVFVLTTAPSGGNCLGNGTGTIVYGLQALESAV